MSDKATTSTGSDKDTSTTTAAPSAAELQEQLTRLSGKLQKYEEDICWKDKQINDLKKSKEERDAMLEDKANSGDADAIKQIKNEYTTRLLEAEDKLKTNTSKLESELKQERVSARAMAKAAQLFKDGSIELLKPKIDAACDWEDGEIVIKDEKGEVRRSAADYKKNMTLDEYMSELAEKYPALAQPTAQTGTMKSGEKRSASSNSASSISLSQFDRMIAAGQTSEARKSVTPEQAQAWLKQIKI